MKRLIILGTILAAAAAPALAAPFDAPFTGNVDIDVVGMSLTGNNGGLGTWNANYQSSTAGSVTIDGARNVTAGMFGLTYRINASTPLGGIDQTITRTFQLVGLLDNLGGPYTVPLYPLDATDAVPPSDPVGALSGDSNFRTLEGSVSLGNNVALNAEKLVLTSLVSRAPIVGGEQFVYDALLNLSAHHPAVGAIILGMSGQVTINATPEPVSLVLLGAALPLLRRRRA